MGVETCPRPARSGTGVNDFRGAIIGDTLLDSEDIPEDGAGIHHFALMELLPCHGLYSGFSLAEFDWFVALDLKLKAA